MADVARSVEFIKKAWIESRYYEDAEKWTGIFWHPQSDFRRAFEELDVRRCIELACGHGRHAEQLMHAKGQDVDVLYCLDVVANNVQITSERLASFPQAKCLLIDGQSFAPIEAESITAIYCYDAMVHFSPDIIECYLSDAHRVLRSGGRVLLHHSNLDAPQTGLQTEFHYGRNPHARNHMTLSLLTALVAGSGLHTSLARQRHCRRIQSPPVARISSLPATWVPSWQSRTCTRTLAAKPSRSITNSWATRPRSRRRSISRGRRLAAPDRSHSV